MSPGAMKNRSVSTRAAPQRREQNIPFSQSTFSTTTTRGAAWKNAARSAAL